MQAEISKEPTSESEVLIGSACPLLCGEKMRRSCPTRIAKSFGFFIHSFIDIYVAFCSSETTSIAGREAGPLGAALDHFHAPHRDLRLHGRLSEPLVHVCAHPILQDLPEIHHSVLDHHGDHSGIQQGERRRSAPLAHLTPLTRGMMT